MKPNPLKARLKSSTPTFGSWITLPDPSIAEIMAGCGFDWLTIDMEHGPISISDAQRLIQVIDLAGCVPLVRVRSNDKELIKQVMDAGAYGVIVPMVNSKAEAERAVAAVRYPPEGVRGVGLARAQNFGQGFEAYVKWQKTESVVIVQIEHRTAVDNLEEILSVPGIDAFFVGPYDLSGSYGVPGQFDHPEMLRALERISAIAEKHRIASGRHVIPTDPAGVTAAIKQGYRFIAYSLDTLFLSDACRNNLKIVKESIPSLKLSSANAK